MDSGFLLEARILDAASDLIVADGYENLTITDVAARANTSEEQILRLFGSLPEALVTMLNREFSAIYVAIVDNIERDPRGGLLSRIYFYTLVGVYERPLAKTLYTSDRTAMQSIMRSAKSFGYVPGVGIRASFIEDMQRVGMVRRDVDARTLSSMLTVFSAGLALTAPHEELDTVVSGICDVLARAVDTSPENTEPGKQEFYRWAMSLVQS